MLTQQQIDFYEDNGYLHIPQVFTPQQVDQMSEDLNWMMDSWAVKTQGWTGPWRRKYMDAATEKASKLIAMHDLYFYAQSWMEAVTHPKLTEAMSDLLGPVVELHHSTMHVKPPEAGHPFPMHQDWAFYEHQDGRYVDVLVHLDDTCHDNGEIRFLAGSHKQGVLEHITRDPETDQPCTPHLPTDQYRLADTVAVPAKRGDVVCFNIHTIHGSHINVTDQPRRLVRIGYRNPDNRQTGGQSMGRPGLIVRGRRQRRPGMELFAISGPAVAGAGIP
ncbi:MAG: phytanoyl-CoA dioxygenase family protein [Phycisphaeraceae bacterium]|nr:phytanoyl-CoA dioxygenase family protein [Phycisphaeraceae bacterium]